MSQWAGTLSLGEYPPKRKKPAGGCQRAAMRGGEGKWTMSKWQDISTAPKGGAPFLATDGVFLGVGQHERFVQPDEIRDLDGFAPGLPLPPLRMKPNPRAGMVDERYSADAFHAYDGVSEVTDYDGPIIFKPTHWMPLPDAPKEKSPPASASGLV